MASAEDGINRNKLRQEAGRHVQHVTCGVAERETHREVLLHVEDRFAHVSHEELRPLVLPPQLPSIARPREPQTAKFSRGVALHPKFTRGSSAGASLSVAAVTGDSAHVGADGNLCSFSVSTEASTEALSASTGFTDAHRWEMPNVADRAFFRRFMEDAQTSADDSTAYSSATAQLALCNPASPSPLDLLLKWEEKYAYLCELERAERQYVRAYERWDQQVILEMMAVHFVALVLKPCMDVLRQEELEQREAIMQEEDRLSFYMYNDFPLALQLQEGKKALKARELQLDRILGLTPATPRLPALPEAPAKATPGTPVAVALASAAAPPQSEGVSKGLRLSSPSSARAASPVAAATPDTGIPSDEARRILRKYVQQRHGALLNVVGTWTTTPQDDDVSMQTMITTYPGARGYDTVHRSSALFLPSISSTQAPIRNAVGIVDYVALLDESTKHREQIVKTEERCRADMNQTCYEELQVVLEWQRRRMHLERLVYWRHQREAAVQKEVEALTNVTPVLRLDAKVLRLLEILEGEEEAARQSIRDEERASFEPLWQTNEDLSRAFNNVSLQERCMATLDSEVWTTEAVARRKLVTVEETDVRHHRERLCLEHLISTLTSGMSQRRALWHVSTCPVLYSAVQVLQKAFRRFLRGRLGWRFTHQALGREINYSRNARKITTGRLALQSFKATLSAEKAQLCEEQAQQHLREQYALFANESGLRTALCAEQECGRKRIARTRVLDVEEVYAPLFIASVALEEEVRLELEVEEELERGVLLATNATLVDVIGQKSDTQREERGRRKAAVRKERASWRQLLSAECDEREEHRIDEEAREAARETSRSAFTEAAEDESRRHHGRAMGMYVACMREALLDLLDREVSDDAARRGIEQEEAVAARHLLDSMATTQCAAYASDLERRHQLVHNGVHQQAICIAETENRASILHREAAAWATTEPELRSLFVGPLHDLMVRCGAVKVISTWYTAVRNGEVGRTVSRQLLREDLAHHHKERQLRSQQIMQRLHTQHVRSQLDTLMMEMHTEQQGAVRQLLDVLVKCDEPRGRAQVESLQEIIFGILERNAKALLAEIRLNFINSEALIWQQELYERKALKQAWHHTFEKLLERKHQELSKDYFALRIQRAWRGCAARMQHRRNLSTQCTRLVALEVQERAALELEELEEVAAQLYQPWLSFSYVETYVRGPLARAYDELAVAVVDATRVQEWSERVALLWEMRYEDCDSCLCEDEARARRMLETQFHKPFLLQSELKDEERLKRTMLERERTLFLLRILAREEHQRRLSLVSVEGQGRASLHIQLTAATPVDAREL
ncbi:conserved hypothetical protein [Leishmania braziliensis MHOM/BR/75/M2904]|uniref:Uncharacterized protein n=2 Tax=Leishmania braziliensis TaxID=5660 RepID=A4HH36_LEIBR|nr:conserved hypothetical protein [Leishmania braziliensis MHOM/BR/75/M2904]CAJ2476322.1 unnamed protein product [Leishmania braziliensis]CAM39885.1 conserved hypothetical protein [Leishmania braziliensis MHOM/BR/75/M2904]SYZ67555.1 hypothetical_protein [Leishmania braziliensis MHOM/BR/75/M2904]